MEKKRCKIKIELVAIIIIEQKEYWVRFLFVVWFHLNVLFPFFVIYDSFRTSVSFLFLLLPYYFWVERLYMLYHWPFLFYVTQHQLRLPSGKLQYWSFPFYVSQYPIPTAASSAKLSPYIPWVTNPILFLHYNFNFGSAIFFLKLSIFLTI